MAEWGKTKSVASLDVIALALFVCATHAASPTASAPNPAVGAATNEAADQSIGYRHDVLPILSDRCFKCHGPDSASRQAGLRLDRPDGANSALESGSTAIVPGKPDASALIERIESDDPDVAMPPADSGKTLSPKEKSLLRLWIENGAEYEPHWAFVAPQRPPVPKVAHADKVQNPIDAFILARLETDGVERSPRASKERLIRRLSFDLVGLPPTLAEIDAFLADDSPDAYVRVVERLLASPHYGERMAADWLDGARFADSNGYQNDFARNMSAWRDWVIAAYNSHMRYDKFVIEQIAGDMLPNATLQQRIATGFNRNHRTVTEAGSIEEEWLTEHVVDRVETVGTTILGLTIGCARCHDHKFDPITQRDFYQFFAFFNNVNEKGVYTETRGNVAPLVKVTSPGDDAKLADFDAKIAEFEKQRAEEMAKIGPQRQAWIDTLATTKNPTEPEPLAAIKLTEGATARVAVTGIEITPDADSAPPKLQRDFVGDTAVFEGEQQLAYSGLNFPPSDRPFSWCVWVKPSGEGAILAKMDSAAGARGCDLFLFGDGNVGIHLVDNWPANALKVRTKKPLPNEKWAHVIATYDGSSKAAGVTLYVNGVKQEVDVEADILTGTFATDQPFRIGRRSTEFPLHAAVADVRLFAHTLTASEVEIVLRGAVERGLVGAHYDRLDESQRPQFDEFMLAYSSDPDVMKAAEAKRALVKTQQEKSEYEAAIPTVMVMEERTEPRETYLLKRGQYDQPDKSVRLMPGVPAALPPLPSDAPANRLGLARWLTSLDNPLTARVIVNRLWQQFFGLGLVKTSDNFGVQSEPPSHPELLDWLAVELIDSGWDLQHIQRLIVASDTYQQQSDASPEAYKRDPDNRLLARGPRRRLAAEAIRDDALAVSGILTDKIGGPSIMPYQPEGLWEELQGGAFEIYKQAQGDDLYRRSLYVYRKRTVPHPSMSTFDAPSWEFCQVKRATTNTPLQALAMLNDVTYVEAARKFAERMLLEGGNSPAARLAFAFRLATSRAPTQQELAMLEQSLQKYLVHYHESPEAAEQMIAHGESPRDKSLDPIELAAHTAVAGILLNLDEAVSKN